MLKILQVLLKILIQIKQQIKLLRKLHLKMISFNNKLANNKKFLQIKKKMDLTVI